MPITRSWLTHGVPCVLLLHWTLPCSAQRPGAAVPLSPGQTVMHQHISVNRGRRTCEARRSPSAALFREAPICPEPHQRLGAAHNAVQGPRFSLEGLQALQSYEVRVSYAGSVCFHPVLIKHLVSAVQAALLQTHGSGAGACRPHPALAIHRPGGGPLEGPLTQVGDRRPARPAAAWGPGGRAAGPEAVAARSGACSTPSGWRSAPPARRRCETVAASAAPAAWQARPVTPAAAAPRAWQAVIAVVEARQRSPHRAGAGHPRVFFNIGARAARAPAQQGRLARVRVRVTLP
jgi:hypothetical protein